MTAIPNGPGVYPIAIRDPHADATTQPFWSAALEGRLVAARCETCGETHLPAPPVCHVCRSDRFAWIELPGTGRIYTFTVVRHPLSPHLAEATPYVTAVIELDGAACPGARLLANVIDCDPDKVAIGDPVDIIFDRLNETFAAPRARPRRAARHP